MTRITPRQRRLAELEEDIRWFKEEQEFKLLCDDDPFDDLDLLLEADLILSNSLLSHNCSLMFCPMQYLIGDCAFAARWWVVPCFKKPPGCVLPREKEIFNKTIARPRVTSEHVNGLLKNRFPFLRSLRFRLTHERKSMKRVLTYITVAVILHNLLIGFGDASEVGEDEVSDIDEDNELNRAIPNGDGNTGGLRREQLKNFIMENYHV
jgi:DDE superfamily endonuclease